MSEKLPAITDHASAAARPLPDLSRREFLGHAAATSALLAAGGAGGLAAWSRAEGAEPSGLPALIVPVQHILELEGQIMGRVSLVSGGIPGSEVVLGDPVLTTGRAKALAAPTCETLIISFGLGLLQPWYAWIEAALNGHPRAKSGRIIEVADNRQVRSLRFNLALVSEVILPDMPGNPNLQAQMTVKLLPKSCSLAWGSGEAFPPVGVIGNKRWIGEFRLSLQGLESATQHALRLLPLVFEKEPRGKGEVVNTGYNFPDLRFVVAESAEGFGPLYQWYNDLVVTARASELPGVLELTGTDTDHQSVFTVMRVVMSGMGIRLLEFTTVGNTRAVLVTCYVEFMQFNFPNGGAACVTLPVAGHC